MLEPRLRACVKVQPNANRGLTLSRSDLNSGAISERAPLQESLKLCSRRASLSRLGHWAVQANSGIYVNDLLFEMYAPNSEASYNFVPSCSSSNMHMMRDWEAEGGG